MVHTCNPSSWETEAECSQENQEFRASLGHGAKKKEKNKQDWLETYLLSPWGAANNQRQAEMLQKTVLSTKKCLQ
jgi:hypothetical protein